MRLIDARGEKDMVSRMTISEKKMQIVIDNYFKSECDVNTSIRQAFEKGFRIGIKKVPSAQPETHEKRTETHACDCISRRAAIDLVEGLESARLKGEIDLLYPKVVKGLIGLPSAQPDVSEALSILDAIRAGGRIKYSDYCELHDAISEIGE